VSEVYTSILNKLADEYQTLQAKQGAFHLSKAYLLPVLEKLAALGADPSVYNESFVYASVTGDVHKLTDAIRALRTGGFTSTEKPARGEPSFTAYYTHPEGNMKILLAFSSSVCRRVKVGTKTETVDVYELRCEESDEFRAE
jgi:hypothetical protein